MNHKGIALTSATDHRPILSARELSVHYGNRPAIHDISMDILPGRTVSLLGPNGAGKSTLLKVFAGMIPPSHGTVTFEGRPLTGAHGSITYVPQRSDAEWTFPISVLEATLLGLARIRSRWRPFTRDDRSRAMHALQQVGMDQLAGAQIGALSGGQQQRVFLARALVDCGRILLLDEPFTGVDIPTQEMLVELFRSLGDHGTSVIYATHDLQLAVNTSEHVVMLNERIVARGTPGEVMTAEILRKTFGGNVVVVQGSHATASPTGVLTQ